jgi:hypothetical protein
LSNKISSQTNTIVNPKGEWIFDGEVGIKKISSFSNGGSKNWVHFKLSRDGGVTNPGRRAVGGVFTTHFQRDDATY